MVTNFHGDFIKPIDLYMLMAMSEEQKVDLLLLVAKSEAQKRDLFVLMAMSEE